MNKKRRLLLALPIFALSVVALLTTTSGTLAAMGIVTLAVSCFPSVLERMGKVPIGPVTALLCLAGPVSLLVYPLGFRAKISLPPFEAAFAVMFGITMAGFLLHAYKTFRRGEHEPSAEQVDAAAAETYTVFGRAVGAQLIHEPLGRPCNSGVN